MLKFFEVYGPTVGTSVGDEWRAHRRVINTGFTPSTNAAVWRQSTLEMDALISHWHRQGAIIPVMKHWTSRFALHIISAVMFGRNLTWGEHSKVQSDDVPAGFSMSFEQAIFNVLARIGTLYVTPKFLLRLSPTQRIREANVAFGDWTRYMRKLCEDALSRTGEMASKRNKSIIGKSLYSSYTLRSSAYSELSEAICSAIQIEPNQSTFETLQDNNVLGNVFFMILAGHETTGNTLAFTLDLLALYPEYQREIQRELDGLLKDRPWHQWTVDREYAALQKGWSGAVLKESLRLYCVVQFVVRKTVAPLEVVDSQGQTHAIPAGTLCALNFAAAFRDPKTWSKRDIPEAHRQELHNSPAIDFDPSRWLEGDERAAFVDSRSEDAPLLFPFGIGQRHCPGRMFAQIEMTAFVVTLLKDFSLEPVVSETTLQRCGRDESKAIEETRKHGFRTLIDDIDANITLQLTKELPLKIVRRTS